MQISSTEFSEYYKSHCHLSISFIERKSQELKNKISQYRAETLNNHFFNFWAYDLPKIEKEYILLQYLLERLVIKEYNRKLNKPIMVTRGESLMARSFIWSLGLNGAEM
jgi:hypothetical protein